MHVEQDLLATAIIGPWVPPADGPERRQQIYLTLAHWYEAAKFIPHKPQLRDAMLFSPSIKEARKFARMRQKEWRSDWPVTQHSVLVAGLGMLAIQRPELGLRSCELHAIKAGLAPMALPERLVDASLERFDVWRKSPRVCFFGAEVAPTQIVGTRMAKLVAPLPNWTLVSPCHRRTAWRVHDWALAHYIPVEYRGTSANRGSRALAGAILAACDQVVVFEQRRQKRFDYVLQAAKALKRKVSLELYDADDQPAGQMTIL